MPLDLPNLLTLSRIAAILPLALLLAQRHPHADLLAAALFAAAAATDWLDGHLARRSGRSSAFGRMLDPIADKLLVGATLLLLAGHGRLDALALAAALLILLREILVSGLREHVASNQAGGAALPVARLAKWKTAAQMVALTLLLAGGALTGPGTALLAVAAALTLVTGWSYAAAAWRVTRGAEAVHRP